MTAGLGKKRQILWGFCPKCAILPKDSEQTPLVEELLQIIMQQQTLIGQLENADSIRLIWKESICFSLAQVSSASFGSKMVLLDVQVRVC